MNFKLIFSPVLTILTPYCPVSESGMTRPTFSDVRAEFDIFMLLREPSVPL